MEKSNVSTASVIVTGEKDFKNCNNYRLSCGARLSSLFDIIACRMKVAQEKALRECELDQNKNKRSIPLEAQTSRK